MRRWMFGRRSDSSSAVHLSAAALTGSDRALVASVVPGTSSVLVWDARRVHCAVTEVRDEGGVYPELLLSADERLPVTVDGELQCATERGLVRLSGAFRRQPNGEYLFYPESCALEQRRDFVRAHVTLPAAVQRPPLPAVQVETADLSASGVLLRGDGLSGLEQGDVVEVVLQVGGVGALSLPGVVTDPRWACHLAVEFRDLTFREQDLLCGLVYQYQATRLH